MPRVWQLSDKLWRPRCSAPWLCWGRSASCVDCAQRLPDSNRTRPWVSSLLLRKDFRVSGFCAGASCDHVDGQVEVLGDRGQADLRADGLLEQFHGKVMRAG